MVLNVKAENSFALVLNWFHVVIAGWDPNYSRQQLIFPPTHTPSTRHSTQRHSNTAYLNLV